MFNSVYLKHKGKVRMKRGVAQLGSALAWGASGRRFKSGRPENDR